ncbi:hypothetical protein AB8880_12200 [Alphaproteobacteria bacterium LSUCC0684]
MLPALRNILYNRSQTPMGPGSTRQIPQVSAPVPEVASAGARAAMYWLRTGRYFICAKTGVTMLAPRKERVESNHLRRDMFLGIFMNNYHHFEKP